VRRTAGGADRLFLGAYQAALAGAALAVSPILVARMLATGKYRAGLAERLGRYPPGLARLAARRPVWVHAVSVGETVAALPLLAALRAARPDVPLVVSTVTPTGQATARARAREADAICYFPFDFTGPVRRALDAARPRAVLLMETEIWPVFLLEAARRGVPVGIANGRLSDRSFRRYRRVRPLLARCLRSLAFVGAQTVDDAARFVALGADPTRVTVTGNLKVDQAVAPARPGAVTPAGLEADLALPAGPRLLAGSTHQGEEAAVLDAYARVKARVPALRLILAPRHPERLAEVARLLDDRGLAWQRRSARPGPPGAPAPEVLLVDTIGELAALYGVADVAFVGGSLVPVGGHNLLEPAAHARAPLHGPHMHNFREITRALGEAGAALPVSDATGLAEAALSLLDDPARRAALGARALGVVEAGRGATARTLTLVDRVLAATPDAA
jgi:3-deoxy-D-manno-octulosonic-acid transferase